MLQRPIAMNDPRCLKSVAVEAATNSRNAILRRAPRAAVLPFWAVDFGPIEARWHSSRLDRLQMPPVPEI
jgi:hypothetical protein